MCECLRQDSGMFVCEACLSLYEHYRDERVRLLTLIDKTRCLQQMYFKTRLPKYLEQAKGHEQALDDLVYKLLYGKEEEQKELF